MNPNKTDVTAKLGQIGTWQGDATLTSLNVRRPSVANPACIYTGLDCATSPPPEALATEGEGVVENSHYRSLLLCVLAG